MTSSHNQTQRCLAILLALLLAVPASETGLARAQQPGLPPASDTAGRQATAADTTAYNDLPDNPSPAGAQAPAQDQQASPAPSGSNQQPSSDTQQQPNGGTKPLGTAAAPYEKATGVAASRPAGAAIAPAKQKRVRTILISLGVVAGAAVAIGTVAGLSRASSSRP